MFEATWCWNEQWQGRLIFAGHYAPARKRGIVPARRG